MEGAFNRGPAESEITRYSGMGLGYTAFDSDAFNLMVDAHSWESMLTSFEELMAVPQIMDTGPPTMAPASGASSLGLFVALGSAAVLALLLA